MTGSGQTICLCMIVKNEDHVIRRCLESVLPAIDSWVIVDTGSTDGTQETIRSFLADVPGDLYQRPWVDFAHNRSESLAYAAGKADYLLVIDADEVLRYGENFIMPHLAVDSYDFEIRSGPVTYVKTQLLRESLQWRYEGVVHEYVTTDQPFTRERMPGLHTDRIPDGARSRDPLTYRKDAVLLEGALLQEPDNARHMFYLAQSYVDAGELQLGIDRYRKRAAMGGWYEEVWSSLYQVARLTERTGGDWPEALEAYLLAFASHPHRAEPLYHIGLHYQANRQFALAHMFLSQALQIPLPQADILFLEKSIYEVLLPLEYSVSCFYVGKHDEAIRVCNALLESGLLSAEQAQQVTRNRQFSVDALAAAPVEIASA